RRIWSYIFCLQCAFYPHRLHLVSYSVYRMVVPPSYKSSANSEGSNFVASVAFASTHWNLVLEAQGESPAAEAALEKLCRTYWLPIYPFLRLQSARPEEAEDLTQEFFVHLIEHRSLSAVRKEKGRLRCYLLVALKHFLADEQRRVMAIKRGQGQRLIPLVQLRAGERFEIEPADPVT